MGTKTWTPEMIRILKKEYPVCAYPRELAKKLHVSYAALKSRVTVLKLKRKVKNANSGRTTATPKQDAFIYKHYLTMPVKRIADKIGRSHTLVVNRMKQLGLKVPRKIIEKFKKDSQIKKGNVPINKGKKQTEFMSKAAIERTKATRFKKGGLPGNTLYDGAITKRDCHPERGGKPHYYIRIAKGVWKELQIYNWEKKNGPLPKGHVLACKNGNTLDCRPSNWYPLTMADNARRNSGSRNLPDGYVAHLLAGGKNKTPELVQKILQRPDLIESKRLLIQLNRKIKSYEPKK
jgi:hypothetical protein